MNNIIPVSNALMCSACGACKAMCPKDAILFKFSSIGRKFATVNASCINCGLCVKVCPSLKKEYNSDANNQKDKYIGNILTVMTGKATNEKIFSNAQSGGLCTAILTYLFQTNKIDAAIVCKMSFGKVPIVSATLITNFEQLYECQKSCYTPVDILSVLRETQQYTSIAVVGLPCHIQGSVALDSISKKYKNIKYRVGLICDRTLCQGIQNAMLSYFHGTEKVKIDWRRKNFTKDNTYYSYKNAPVVIYNEKGEEYIFPNLYRFALKDMYTPPRCRVCYDKLNTLADIVLGDPWGMSEIDYNKGNSVIITRTQIGQSLIEEMQDKGYISTKKADINELLKGQFINERKQTVSYYSRALSVIPFKINSYLYHQQDTSILPEFQIKKARKEFLQFIKYEALSSEEVVLQAKRKISNAVKREKLSQLLIIRILRKIKSLIVK